jgi:threonine dehydratase
MFLLPFSGSFKIRGASNAVFSMSAEEVARGVVAHSSGNHAGAVALAAKLKGVQAHIVVPHNTPKVKTDAVRSYGGTLLLRTVGKALTRSVEKLVEDRMCNDQEHPLYAHHLRSSKEHGSPVRAHALNLIVNTWCFSSMHVHVAPSNYSLSYLHFSGALYFCAPTIDAREEECLRIQKETGAVFVHPYNDPRVMAGASLQ